MPPHPLPGPPADCGDLDLDRALVSAADLAAELGMPGDLRLWRVGGVPPGVAGHPLLLVLRSRYPRYRFDDPDSTFQVWYGSRTPTGAFLEVFGDRDRGVITPAERAGRVAGEVVFPADLPLLDLRAPLVNQIMKVGGRLDDRVGTTGQYSLTQAWARTIHDCRAAIGGLIYRSRMGGEVGPNIALFDEGMRAATPVDAGLSVDEVAFHDAHEMLDNSGIRWG
jgi:hypothetical protein